MNTLTYTSIQWQSAVDAIAFIRHLQPSWFPRPDWPASEISSLTTGSLTFQITALAPHLRPSAAFVAPSFQISLRLKQNVNLSSSDLKGDKQVNEALSNRLDYFRQNMVERVDSLA
uniref:Uncharacterized protein n=1 Tax=Pseudictyota dubia TaxID=2749911 RepID=A0A7R9WFT8_9STRA